MRFVELAHPVMRQYAPAGIDAELGRLGSDDVDYRWVFGAWHGCSFSGKCRQEHIVEKKRKSRSRFASPPRFIIAASPAGISAGSFSRSSVL
ncbi:hypothetical protein [Bifidobacterium catulorum]|uniref:hypothetical protein n=1 Tax=Bifidobacterium catulorum TaxID=1630173 RepID=UPI0011B1EC9B|nr:hypothetical protein [Bifidobacterium catulorum]